MSFKLCSTCPLNELCALSQVEAKTTVEAAVTDDGSDLCVDKNNLVDELGHTEEEAAAIMNCIGQRTIEDCMDDYDGPVVVINYVIN